MTESESATERQLSASDDIMLKLFTVFRQSIREMNRDMQYWCAKLEHYNDLAQAMSEHLKQLVEQMDRSEEGKDNKDCRASWIRDLDEHQRRLRSLTTTAARYEKTIAGTQSKIG